MCDTHVVLIFFCCYISFRLEAVLKKLDMGHLLEKLKVPAELESNVQTTGEEIVIKQEPHSPDRTENLESRDMECSVTTNIESGLRNTPKASETEQQFSDKTRVELHVDVKKETDDSNPSIINDLSWSQRTEGLSGTPDGLQKGISNETKANNDCSRAEKQASLIDVKVERNEKEANNDSVRNEHISAQSDKSEFHDNESDYLTVNNDTVKIEKENLVVSSSLFGCVNESEKQTQISNKETDKNSEIESIPEQISNSGMSSVGETRKPLSKPLKPKVAANIPVMTSCILLPHSHIINSSSDTGQNTNAYNDGEFLVSSPVASNSHVPVSEILQCTAVNGVNASEKEALRTQTEINMKLNNYNKKRKHDSRNVSAPLETISSVKNDTYASQPRRITPKAMAPMIQSITATNRMILPPLQPRVVKIPIFQPVLGYSNQNMFIPAMSSSIYISSSISSVNSSNCSVTVASSGCTKETLPLPIICSSTLDSCSQAQNEISEKTDPCKKRKLDELKLESTNSVCNITNNECVNVNTGVKESKTAFIDTEVKVTQLAEREMKVTNKSVGCASLNTHKNNIKSKEKKQKCSKTCHFRSLSFGENQTRNKEGVSSLNNMFHDKPTESNEQTSIEIDVSDDLSLSDLAKMFKLAKKKAKNVDDCQKDKSKTVPENEFSCKPGNKSKNKALQVQEKVNDSPVEIVSIVKLLEQQKKKRRHKSTSNIETKTSGNEGEPVSNKTPELARMLSQKHLPFQVKPLDFGVGSVKEDCQNTDTACELRVKPLDFGTGTAKEDVSKIDKASELNEKTLDIGVLSEEDNSKTDTAFDNSFDEIAVKKSENVKPNDVSKDHTYINAKSTNKEYLQAIKKKHPATAHDTSNSELCNDTDIVAKKRGRPSKHRPRKRSKILGTVEVNGFRLQTIDSNMEALSKTVEPTTTSSPPFLLLTPGVDAKSNTTTAASSLEFPPSLKQYESSFPKNFCAMTTTSSSSCSYVLCASSTTTKSVTKMSQFKTNYRYRKRTNAPYTLIPVPNSFSGDGVDQGKFRKILPKPPSTALVLKTKEDEDENSMNSADGTSSSD